MNLVIKGVISFKVPDNMLLTQLFFIARSLNLFSYFDIEGLEYAWRGKDIGDSDMEKQRHKVILRFESGKLNGHIYDAQNRV